MRRGQYMTRAALCPYYKRESKSGVYCCGIYPNTSTHITFGSGTDCLVHKQSLCRAAYKQCPIYVMLEDVESGKD